MQHKLTFDLYHAVHSLSAFWFHPLEGFTGRSSVEGQLYRFNLLEGNFSRGILFFYYQPLEGCFYHILTFPRVFGIHTLDDVGLTSP